ncbi:IS3 family transposase [Rhodanobacter koreensis]
MNYAWIARGRNHTVRVLFGWTMSERPDQIFASDALTRVLARRHPPKEVIHHSDQGPQYTSKAYQHAVMESFFASLKQELTYHERFVDRGTARSQVFDYIESFYNRQRLHSSLDYRSPDVFESMDRVTN